MTLYERCGACSGSGVVEDRGRLRYCPHCDGQGERPVTVG